MIPETYYWTTDYQHSNNTHTMTEYLEDYLPKGFEILEADDSMAIIQSKDGVKYGCHASGNGDFFNHKVEFELMEQKQ